MIYTRGERMKRLYKIKELDIYDRNTTILITSKTKENEYIIELINKNCEVISITNPSNISNIPQDILETFHCEDLINKEHLTKLDEIKINILSSLISSKKTIVFHNILTYMDRNTKKRIIDKLKKQGKQIINFTSEIEESLLLDYLIILHENKIIMEGDTTLVLKEEKIIKKLGFNLPFIVELSKGLKYYNICDKIFYNIESLVDNLWK